MSRLSQVFVPKDREFFDLFEEAAGNAVRAADLLDRMLRVFPENAPDLARDILVCEQDGDRITHDLIHRLSSRSRRRLPFDTQDGHQLATALDDIVDFAEQTADALGIYGVEAPMEQSVALAEVLVEASDEVARALAALGASDAAALAPALSEIHRLESEGDRVLREGLACLFANGIDPMVVIRWKDIFESLESSVDACQTVAHIIEGISLQHGRH